MRWRTKGRLRLQKVLLTEVQGRTGVWWHTRRGEPGIGPFVAHRTGAASSGSTSLHVFGCRTAVTNKKAWFWPEVFR